MLKKHLWLLSILKTDSLLNILWKQSRIYIYKKTAFGFSFFNIIHVFTVTFDQFNWILLFKSIKYLKSIQKSYWPQTFER